MVPDNLRKNNSQFDPRPHKQKPNEHYKRPKSPLTLPVVIPSDTVVEVLAMMIESLAAPIAGLAVLGCLLHVFLALGAVSGQ
jgi:hypothetical protein